jgi:putative membrane protein
MFIDYLTIMLLNLVAGLFLLALFVFKYFEKDQRVMAPGFLITGFIGTVTGFHMIFTWPLPGSNNIAFGEMELLFGVLFLAAGIAVLKDWDLLTITIYAVFAGAAAIVIGLALLNYNMTKSPLLAAAGYVGAGVGAVLTLPVYLMKQNKVLRVIVALILLAAALVWALTTYASYWEHLHAFAKWAPATMPPAPPAAK